MNPFDLFIRKTKNGFTFIEILVTLAIIAVLFIPIMQLFSYSLHSTGQSQDLITAVNLAKWEMERAKNLSITKAQLKAIGNVIYPPLGEEPLLLNNTKWRIKREIMPGSDPLEVRVHVYPVTSETPDMTAAPPLEPVPILPEEPLVSLVTLIEDTTWEEIRAVQ